MHKILSLSLLLLFTTTTVCFADVCDYFCRQEKVKQQVKEEVKRAYKIRLMAHKIEVLARLQMLGAGDTYISSSSSTTIENKNTISQENNQ